jgi:hypothetical protein
MSGSSDLKGVSLVTFFAPAKKVTRSPQECGSSVFKSLQKVFLGHFSLHQQRK